MLAEAVDGVDGRRGFLIGAGEFVFPIAIRTTPDERPVLSDALQDDMPGFLSQEIH